MYALESSRNHPFPHTPEPVEKLSSTKLIPGPKRLGTAVLMHVNKRKKKMNTCFPFLSIPGRAIALTRDWCCTCINGYLKMQRQHGDILNGGCSVF